MLIPCPPKKRPRTQTKFRCNQKIWRPEMILIFASRPIFSALTISQNSRVKGYVQETLSFLIRDFSLRRQILLRFFVLGSLGCHSPNCLVDRKKISEKWPGNSRSLFEFVFLDRRCFFGSFTCLLIWQFDLWSSERFLLLPLGWQLWRHGLWALNWLRVRNGHKNKTIFSTFYCRSYLICPPQKIQGRKFEPIIFPYIKSLNLNLRIFVQFCCISRSELKLHNAMLHSGFPKLSIYSLTK